MAIIEIFTCQECKELEMSRDYTPDSFELCSKGVCKKKRSKVKWKDGRDVFRYLESFDNMPDVPDWCPKRIKETP